MLKSLLVTATARQDIEEIRAWYLQISPRLADDFEQDLNDVFEQILKYPESFVVFHKIYRRVVMYRFKYMVFFRIKDDTAIISIVVHQKRSPIHWQKRLH